MTQQFNPNDIEGYVQDMMSKMFPQHMEDVVNNQNPLNHFNEKNKKGHGKDKKSAIQTSVFETHEYVFVMVTIENEEWLKAMKVYHTSNQLILEHIPELNNKQTITLPAIVKKKGSTAHYKDGMLEVRIPKNIDMQFSEIDVTEVL